VPESHLLALVPHDYSELQAEVCLLGLSTCSTYKRPICQEVISTVVIVLRELLLLVQLLGLTLVLVGIILLAREVPRE